MSEEIVEKESRKEKMIKNIIYNYKQVEESIANQLFMKQDFHGTTIGTQREDIWRQLFEMIVPKKFVIEQSIFIIDSDGNVSHEVDLAIIDETYTPYIFRYGEIKFVPIEAVSVVVECKSQKIDKDAILKWSESVQELKTSVNSIARMASKIMKGDVPTQNSTRPIRILCALYTPDEDIRKEFDFTVVANKETRKIKITDGGNDDLFKWFSVLNFHKSKDVTMPADEHKIADIKLSEYEIKDGDEIISLLSFNFQLNQLLMLINNPILFPHRDYVKLFNRGKKEESK